MTSIRGKQSGHVYCYEVRQQILHGGRHGFYHRQLSNIKEDGSFAYSGGGDNDGWAKLHWNWLTYQWETRQAGDGEGKTDIQWQTYPAAQ